ncbi:DUF948 domain-containing protein [Paenibacillus chibensis]|uniref:DUF948 domain-containing protein n=1 Tax=Paenibacillus chibensis TaxID=59846 RepID=UPI000FD90A08|nr:DUF948 domain-containing protein [Paenibacillus chibensis]MEC0372666.1 DUF948 domain-containing protein [Paenibacillus chibensis]
MLVGISVAIIAVAFAVLVVYLIKTLLAAKDSLEKTTQTLQEVQQTIDELGYEVKQIVRHASDITVDVQHKMKQIDPVMNSVKNLGEVLSEVTLAAKQASSTMIQKFKQTSHRVGVNQHDALPSHSTAEERTLQSYAATYGTAGKGKAGAGWMKYADVAAVIWQKFRH